MFLKPNNNNGASANNTPGKTPSGKKAVPSVVSSDMHILGNIVSDGIIDFDGTIDGNIRCGSLVLRHNGKVNGEVHADNVQVYGRVKGLIKAKSVQLHSTCCVEGIVMHEAISIEDGAIIDGKMKRTNKVPSATGMDDDQEDSETGGSTPKLMDNIRLIAG
jgi:cytoskeletal protein CcmA (bactofilin family)